MKCVMVDNRVSSPGGQQEFKYRGLWLVASETDSFDIAVPVATRIRQGYSFLPTTMNSQLYILLALF